MRVFNSIHVASWVLDVINGVRPDICHGSSDRTAISMQLFVSAKGAAGWKTTHYLQGCVGRFWPLRIWAPPAQIYQQSIRHFWWSESVVFTIAHVLKRHGTQNAEFRTQAWAVSHYRSKLHENIGSLTDLFEHRDQTLYSEILRSKFS